VIAGIDSAMVATVMLLMMMVVGMLMAFQLMLSMIIPTIASHTLRYRRQPTENIPQALRRLAAAAAAVAAVAVLGKAAGRGKAVVGAVPVDVWLLVEETAGHARKLGRTESRYEVWEHVEDGVSLAGFVMTQDIENTLNTLVVQYLLLL
jgi:hypothetical protein